ncbi:FtsK/SpoIIIE domain-containing protein [Dermabacter vaginalis]|uniref:FtsK/SpoIIIE domain-containing protein n=1 Tax=Dermabacter vaginalis TaxID=1630135 RepID=UPI0021A2ECCD|nr:FtsK/SpoIIIE domain-containing protein [Dermabacter vaginalis]MCT2150907.1 FtsK/SpoIIIE domain-containing protein [Dermabacter vaginalis]
MTLLVEVIPPCQNPVVLEVSADSTVRTGEFVERLRHHFGLEGEGYALRVGQRSQQGFPGALLANEQLLHVSGLMSGMSVELVQASVEVERPGERIPSSWELVLERNGVQRVVPLEKGLSSIGSSTTCRVTLEHGDVASTHAYLETCAEVKIHAAQGAILKNADGGQVRGAHLKPDSCVYVGQWKVGVRHRAGADVVVNDSPARAYLPPARIELAEPAREIALPRVPRPAAAPPFPTVSLLVPLMIAGVMYTLTRSSFVIMLAVVMPAMALAHYWSQCARVRKESSRALREFEEAVDEAKAEVHGAHEGEKARLGAMLPAACVIAEWDSPKRGDLWALREEHSDFLTLRLGTGRVESAVQLKGETLAEGPREQRGELEMLRESARMFEGPVTVSLRRARGLGITGAGRMGCAVGLGVQLGGRHSPSDVRLALVCSSDACENARGLAWLPHARSSDGGKAQILESDEAVIAWAARHMPDLSGDADGGSSHVVILALDPTPAQLTPLTVLVEAWEARGERGPRLIVTAADSAHLPGVCSALLEVEGNDGIFWQRGEVAPIALNACEGISNEAAHVWARRLASLMDARSREHANETIPATVSLLDVNGVERHGLRTSLSRAWRTNDRAEARTLDALVGYGETGPLTIPLRAWGPHALVAGTTGSGKSEFLQSWILSLALRYSPRRLTFLFVDYKGGAGLGECALLPHCTGLVTDLGPDLVTRALISLKAELRYREELLARCGAKDSDDYAERGGDDLPAFVIVVDEFAALRDHCPEFLEGLIDVAQRGRSLGIHLILATQRPAGIVSERLRANVSLRIALRLSDTADSLDVIGSKAAAHISLETPGRAVVSAVGAGFQHEAQMAYAGARGEDDRSTRLGVSLAHAMNDEEAKKVFNAQLRLTSGEASRGEDRGPTDASLVVKEAIDAWARSGETVRAPWLPPLAESYEGEKLVQDWGLPAPFALVDDPSRQRRTVARLGPPGSVYGVYGASGTGRSTSIVNIVRATRTAQERPRLFILDSVSKGLRGLVDETQAVAYVSGDDTASVLRMLRHLTNTKREVGPSILAIDSCADLCHEAHPSDREDILSLLGALARTARARRLTLIIGASGPSELPRSLETACTERIVHRLSRAEDYAMCGTTVRLSESAPVGRVSIGGREAQIALFEEPSVRGDNRRRACLEAFVLARRTLGTREAVALVRDSTRALVGFSHADGEPVSLPLKGGGLIVGGEGSDRLALLESLAALARDRENLRVPQSSSGYGAEACRVLERASALGPKAFVILDNVADLESDSDAAEIGVAARAALAAGACVFGGLEGGSFSRLGSLGPILAHAGCGIVLGSREAEVFTVFGRTPPRTRWANAPDVAWLVEGADCRLIVPAYVREYCHG